MRNSIFRMAGILAAAVTLFCGGCGDNGASSGVTSGGNVDKLLDTLRGTNDPKAPTLYKLDVTVEPKNSGTFSKSPNNTQYEKGVNVRVTATPNSGYRFTGWSGVSSDTATSITVKMDGPKTLIAHFVQENVVTYTLTVNANPTDGGTVSKSPDKPQYEKDDNVLITATPKTGYKFTQWSGSLTGTKNPETVKMEDRKKEITANFEKIPTYSITFNANGGRVSPTSGTTGEGGRLDSLPSPTRDGYQFNGWYTDTTGGSAVTESRTYSANTVIYARWTLIKYRVTFNANGGSVTPTFDSTGIGGRLSFLPTPTRNGYKFDGWYTATAGGTEVTTSTPFNENMTIYAQWTAITANQYVITFNANGGTGSPPSQLTVNAGSSATLPNQGNLSRSGYTFGGWNTNSYGTGNNYSAGDRYTPTDNSIGNVTLYAKWTLITYTITLNANGGTVSPTSDTTGEGGRLASLPTPTRNGYKFDGWFTAATGGTEVTTRTVFSANTTVYARWTLNTYTITFNANGGTVSPTSATTGADGRLASLPTPTRSGYTFDGWFTATTGGTEITTSTVLSANSTVYAHWTLNTYTITFNANNGSVSPTSATTGADGRLASLPTPTRSGYTFDGWYTATSGGTQITTSTVFSANTTVYARWTLNTYTITFNANGGTVSPTSATTGADGRLASLPTPTRSNYTFNGWFTATSGGTQVTTSTVFSVSTTVYARWTQLPIITFNANGGSVSPTSATTGADGRLASLPTPTRSNYTFNGWFTATSGGTQVTTSTVFSANTTIYARWTFIPTLLDNRDQKTYKSVLIGNQIWMAQNLNYDVPNSTSDVCYNNSSGNCSTYGRMYDWSTARTACPSGWHLPSDAEWTTLVNYVGGSSTAGTKLKSKTGWYSYDGVPAGSDTYGFSALPGGAGYSDGRFNYVGYNGFWWSATEGGTSSAWYRDMYYCYEHVGRYDGDKSYLFSVRCVQD